MLTLKNECVSICKSPARGQEKSLESATRTLINKQLSNPEDFFKNEIFGTNVNHGFLASLNWLGITNFFREFDPGSG